MGVPRSQTGKRPGGRSFFENSSTVSRERNRHYHVVRVEDRSLEIRYLRYVSRRKIPRGASHRRDRQSPLRQGQGTFYEGPRNRQAFDSGLQTLARRGVAIKIKLFELQELSGRDHLTCRKRRSPQAPALRQILDGSAAAWRNGSSAKSCRHCLPDEFSPLPQNTSSLRETVAPANAARTARSFALSLFAREGSPCNKDFRSGW